MKKLTNFSEFFIWDYPNTLFPLKLNLLLVQKYSQQLRDFINRQTGFQPQHRVFASKRGWFLRRTMKLDPVAEFFLYDIIYKNRKLFRNHANGKREVHGFRLYKGKALSPLKSYVGYKDSLAQYRALYKCHAYFDIASYFNHIYHHDLVRWFEDLGADSADVQLLGTFLREIAGGRSVDCLPQGLYPSKMIGSAFLLYLEASTRIRSKQTVRLMDDMWIFDNSDKIVITDFLQLQAMLSERGLSLNDSKSKIVQEFDLHYELPGNIDDMKVDLLRKRRERLREDNDYGEAFDEDEEHEEDESDPEDLEQLEEGEQEYLIHLLHRDNIQEEDAELVLTLMREHSSDVLEFLPGLIRNFPGLAKKFYYFCKDVPDKDEVSAVLLDVTRNQQVTEYQLFWFAAMVEDYLLKTKKAGELIGSLYENERSTAISRAKILEIPDKKYGLSDMREEHLKTGQSDWLAWSSACGSRIHPKGQRNQLLKYFRKSSTMNQLIGEFVENCF